MTDEAEVSEATPADAAEIAEIHLAARREAMPYLHRPFTDAETRDWFAHVVATSPAAWWVVRSKGQIVGYMLLNGADLDHLYVRPDQQGLGFGMVLLAQAKALSPGRLALSVFRKNLHARSFYAAHGFVETGFTCGDNQEQEPDVQYVWEVPPV